MSIGDVDYSKLIVVSNGFKFDPTQIFLYSFPFSFTATGFNIQGTAYIYKFLETPEMVGYYGYAVLTSSTGSNQITFQYTDSNVMQLVYAKQSPGAFVNLTEGAIYNGVNGDDLNGQSSLKFVNGAINITITPGTTSAVGVSFI